MSTNPLIELSYGGVFLPSPTPGKRWLFSLRLRPRIRSVDRLIDDLFLFCSGLFIVTGLCRRVSNATRMIDCFFPFKSSCIPPILEEMDQQLVIISMGCHLSRIHGQMASRAACSSIFFKLQHLEFVRNDHIRLLPANRLAIQMRKPIWTIGFHGVDGRDCGGRVDLVWVGVLGKG
ncbi:hypothetical protein VNO77_42280 [Canavalia gladiata]|uniref:Uncharacterized protein n=1 Tax=Canavalia gladiata TaxID=3824 RepID=A0AAN9PQV7_CANGL